MIDILYTVRICNLRNWIRILKNTFSLENCKVYKFTCKFWKVFSVAPEQNVIGCARWLLIMIILRLLCPLYSLDIFLAVNSARDCYESYLFYIMVFEYCLNKNIVTKVRL